MQLAQAHPTVILGGNEGDSAAPELLHCAESE